MQAVDAFRAKQDVSPSGQTPESASVLKRSLGTAKLVCFVVAAVAALGQSSDSCRLHWFLAAARLSPSPSRSCPL